MLDKLKNLFSNDKNPAEAEKNQKLNQIIIGGGAFTLLILIMFIFGDDNTNKKYDNIGDFKIVNEDKMVKTKWIGEASTDVMLTNKKVKDISRENKKLKQDVEQLKKMLIEMKKNQNLNNSNLSTTSTKTNQNQKLYKNFPFPIPGKKDNKDNPENYGLKKFGKVPELKKDIIEKEQVLKDSLGYQTIQQPDVKKNKKEELKPLNVISTGTISKVTLLGGMDAPTMAAAKTNPLPVLMRVDDLSFLPNNWKEDIQGCFILGEGYGDLSSERAYIRTTTLSCVTKNGYHIDTPFKGAVYGEDGKAGLRGRVVTKQGALLARTLIAGFLQGISDAFKQSNTIVSVTPQGSTQTLDPKKAIQSGLFNGASAATNKLAEFYLKMADQIAPVIEISAGRRVDVIATDMIKLKPIELQKKGNKK